MRETHASNTVMGSYLGKIRRPMLASYILAGKSLSLFEPR